jgi:Ca2+-binding EF-hand superfamily protein
MTDPIRFSPAAPAAACVAALLAFACGFAPVAFALDTDAEFAVIDSNDDGRISSGEHEVYARRLFDEMDSEPDDDKLTRAEIMANESKFIRHVFTTGNILGPADLSTAEKIQRLDVNGDGVISQTEHANGAAAKFQKMDINNNGELTPEEFDAGG